jgi:hypothetical protein
MKIKFSLPFIPNEAVKKIYFHLSPVRDVQSGCCGKSGKANFRLPAYRQAGLQSNCAVTETSFP